MSGARTTKSDKPHKRAAIYSRVSTPKEEQENALGAALERLRAYAAARGFEVVLEETDRRTAADLSRAGYRRALEACRRREVDVLLITRLERLARSAQELIRVGEELAAWGVDLVCVDQPIDTTTPAGKLTFHLFAILAEFERAMIRERVLKGMETARARGRIPGPAPKAPDLVPHARALVAGGLSVRQAARRLEEDHGIAVSATWVARRCAGIPRGVRAAAPQGTLTPGAGVARGRDPGTTEEAAP